MKVSLLIPVLALGACAPKVPCAMNSNNPGIVGGERVETGADISHHVVALVGKGQQSQFLCTGVIISSDSILTAGHCGAEMRAGRAVFSTDLSTAKAKQIRTIVRVEVQPKFEETVERLSTEGEKRTASRLPKNWGDVAIMKFEGDLPRGYSPISFEDSETLSNGEAVTLAGYGLMSEDDTDPAAYLNAVDVPVKNAKFSRTEFSVDQSDGKGACHGDSGGPAFASVGGKLILVGITSRGSDAHCKRAGIYTKVSAFQDWINSSINR